MEMFLVGGIVRDMLLGLKPKDHDFTVVLDTINPDPFAVMRLQLIARGVEIFVETPSFLTIRGRFAKDDPEYPGIAGDFVLARKDSLTSDGRRPDSVEPGTLEDDLARRDFTVNAMAMKNIDKEFWKGKTAAPRGKWEDPVREMILSTSELIDPHGGERDLGYRCLRFVGDPMTRIQEDALRVMRAFRFVVTKGFWIDVESLDAIRHPDVPPLLEKISEDRRAEELSRMFRFDTETSLDILANIPRPLRAAMFAGRVRLDSTLKR